MPQQLWAFCLYEDGATATSLVAVAAFATMINLGDTLEMMFGVVSNGVTNSVNSSING
jgi:hypothetical protein